MDRHDKPKLVVKIDGDAARTWNRAKGPGPRLRPGAAARYSGEWDRLSESEIDAAIANPFPGLACRTMMRSRR